ncbi:MAG: InlB B-repeat-containing protein [Bacteroidales bacterium]|nr:InlB B-repeat-containing protein [Bacteroidales bacterium]
MCSFTTNTVVTSEYYFAGNFDGNGYTITLDYTLGGISTGLFRYVDCPDNYPTPVIKNLNVAGTITATVNTTPEHDGIGAIVGKLGRGTLQNCTSSVTIIDNGHTLKHVGGLVGAMYQATVIDCAFTGSLNCDHSYDAIGGIVGYASYEHNFVIKNCLSTGNITVMSSTNTYAGGILGYVRDNSHTSNSKNNYWLSNGVNQTNGGGGAIGGASKTDAEMKSGQVSRLLNGGDGSTENADGAWGNTVGSNYPSLGGPTVYKVSFDANGGSGSMSDAYIHASPLPANLFTAPEGCSFKSWSTSANGNFVSSISSDGTLYAIWQVIAVNYIDVDGSSQSVSATPLLSEMTMLPDGWYVVNKDVTISSRVSCLGHVKLILADGKTFTASKGIGVNRYNTEEQEEQEVAGGIPAVSLNTLTIYGQSAQTGALTAGGTLDEDEYEYFAGIGGDANKSSGLITINGGIVTANGGEWAAGIGSGYNRTGTVTINGGTVTAIGGERAAGIGSGYRDNCVVTIKGGTVTANGGEEAAGIGGGCRNIDNGTVTISGGNINATAGSNASAIGSGYEGYGVTITITGGNFATGDVEGNTVYGIAPAAGYVVFSSGNTTYPYAVVKNPIVTFYANDGTDTMATQEVPYNTATALAANTFTYLGYEYAGWNTAANGSGTSYTDGQSVELSSDLTLYAQWKGVLTNSMIADIPAQEYTGSAITPTVTVSFDGEHNLTQGTDYIVSYANNVNAGDATVTGTGIGNYTGTPTKTFQIYSYQSLAGATITLPYTYYARTGSALMPTPTVKYGETTLTLNTDYTLTYSNNTNAGDATVTVTGIGNYIDSKDVTFTIVNIQQSGGFYQIGTPEQLLAFVELCNDNSSNTYSAKQTADINLNDYSWRRINELKGTYDGQSHTISNMKYGDGVDSNNNPSNPDYKAKSFVDRNRGTITNMTFTGASEFLNESGNGSAVVAVRNNGTISLVSVANSTVQIGAYNGIAGLCVYNESDGTITNCAVVNTTLRRRFSGATENKYLGGGICDINNGTVSNCMVYDLKRENTDHPVYAGIVYSGNQPTNSYYYASFTSNVANDGTKMTAEQCSNGQITRLLNGGNGTTESASGAWRQTIGTDQYPVLGGPEVYKVTFYANGGTSTMEAQYLNSGQTLTANTFTAPGYTFAGWATSADGEVVYEDGQDVTLTEDLTLYAKWVVTPCEYYDIPYTYDFEAEAPFGCWTPITGVSRTNNTSHAHNSTYYLRFSGTTSNLVALPQFNEATNNLRVEFWTRPETIDSICGTFSMGYMTDINDASTFVEVANYAYNDWTSPTYAKKTVDFINAPANANIAFRHNAGSTSWCWYVDDVTIEEVPAVECEKLTLDENNEWSENFDNLAIESTERLTGTTMGDCWTWTRLVELPTDYVDTVPQIYNRSAFAHSGDYSLLLWHRGVYAMPELDSTININELKMSFYVRQSYSFYTLLVGVMTDPTDPETFVPVAHVDNGTSTGVEYVEVNFANYQGEGRYIAFKNVRPTATTFDGDWNDIHSVNYIDDIKLSLKEEGDCVIGLPYPMDFDDVTPSTNALTGAMPECWEMVQNDLDEEIPFDKMPQVYCKSSFANSGNYSLRMVNRCVYAMPMLADTIDMSKVQLSMSVRQPNARYQLYVGVWSDGEFYPVALVDNATTGYEDFSCDFSKYDGPVGRIAFRNVLSKGKSFDYSYNYLDDIVVSLGETPVCDAVTNLNVTESFEDYIQSTIAATGVMPTCWEVVEKDVEMAYDKYPQVYNNPNFAGTGDYSLVMIDRCVIAMPELEDGIELNDVTLTMKLRQPNTQYQLEIGVWEVGYDENQEPIEQFVPVATLHNADNTVTEVSCDFANYTGNGNRIAFRNTLKSGNYNYSYNYLDDITLTLTEAKIAESSNANVIDEIGVERYLEGIVVYPNPTVGELHIGAVDVQKVECYNQMGQLVAVYNNDRDINISALADGVYTLRITVPQGVTMRKVVKR